MEKTKKITIPTRAEPDWNDELRNRKAGSTTLKQCGWCKYRGTGSYRHDCMIEGNCKLLPDYDEENDVRWDTPCVIINKGKEDIARYIKSHKYAIEDSKKEIKREQEIINNLRGFISKAKNIPPLPWNRGAEHFNVGDRIAAYDESSIAWRFGTVVYGYRHHDGCVSFHLDETPEPVYEYLPATKMKPGKYPGGEVTKEMAEKMNEESEELVKKIGKLAKSPGCGIRVPTIMLKSEYDYFANNTKEWKNWRDTACSKSYNVKKISIEVDPNAKNRQDGL